MKAFAIRSSLERAFDIILCRNVEVSVSLGIMAIRSHLGLLYPYGHDIPKGVGYCLLLSDRSFHNLGTIMAIVSTLFPKTRSTNRRFLEIGWHFLPNNNENIKIIWNDLYDGLGSMLFHCLWWW